MGNQNTVPHFPQKSKDFSSSTKNPPKIGGIFRAGIIKSSEEESTIEQLLSKFHLQKYYKEEQ